MIKKALIRFLNNLKLHNKFLIMYVFCMIIPLILTDTVIFYSIYQQEYNLKMNELKNTAIAYQNEMTSIINYDAKIVQAICDTPALRQFLDFEYTDPHEYYLSFYDFVNNSFFQTVTGMRNDRITIFTNNPTISNGQYFRRLSTAREQEWFERFTLTGKNELLMIYQDDNADPNYESTRKMIYIQRVKNVYDSKYDKIVSVEIDTQNVEKSLFQVSNAYPMYISVGNYTAFTRSEDFIYSFNTPEQKDFRLSVTHSFDIFGCTVDIHVYSDDILILQVISDKLWLILVFVLFTLVIPIILMKLIEVSLSKRISMLGNAFRGSSKTKFQPIADIEGNDEISNLMNNYNRIVQINNGLINTLYKDKLREQESDLARKNAELLALQSQINPHFMFNALESIRMHSILKGEDETAEMVEKLAVMERQNVDWGEDLVSIKKETESIEAYLYLQSYRFGDRLSFDIDIEENCDRYLIPKLTLVTFVENACVHGIESKSSAGWIFVRVYKEREVLCMEVEDTGDGMNESEVSNLNQSIANVSIDQIKGKKHVGILNACLRLKIHFENQASIVVESERGVGMSVLIRIPLDKLKMVKE